MQRKGVSEIIVSEFQLIQQKNMKFLRLIARCEINNHQFTNH